MTTSITTEGTPPPAELTLDELRARVQKGIAWLHECRPGWFDRIDLDALDLQSGCSCVLGQEHLGDYPGQGSWRQYVGAFARALNDWCPETNDGAQLDWAIERGFYIDDSAMVRADEADLAYARLTAVWRSAIEAERRARDSS